VLTFKERLIMKRRASIFGIFAFLTLFLFSACNGARTRADIQDDLADIREEKMEIVNKIDQALAMTDIDDFVDKARDALDDLDNQIDEYHNTMDRANMRIDEQTRQSIINMKQKRAAIEFKLDLLEENGGWFDDGRDTRRTGTDWDGDDRADRRRTDPPADQRRDDARTDWEDDTRDTQWDDTRRDDTRRDDTRRDRRWDDDPDRRDTRWDDDRRRDDVDYAPELFEEVKDDLQELRREIEEFTRRNL
jgi:hypothetical protein